MKRRKRRAWRMGEDPSESAAKQGDDKKLRDVEDALGGAARVGAVKAETRLLKRGSVQHR